VSAKAGPQHYGAELAEAAEAMAERIMAEELTKRKGDAEKVAMALRLRRETTPCLSAGR
jgi:oligoendopeptidase F